MHLLDARIASDGQLHLNKDELARLQHYAGQTVSVHLNVEVPHDAAQVASTQSVELIQALQALRFEGAFAEKGQSEG